MNTDDSTPIDNTPPCAHQRLNLLPSNGQIYRWPDGSPMEPQPVEAKCSDCGETTVLYEPAEIERARQSNG